MEAINNIQEFDQLISLEKLVIADFYADWCGPCQVLLPAIAEIAKEYQGRAEVVKVNVDNNKDLAIRFGIRNIPTLLFIKNQEVVDRTVGVQSRGEIEKRINNMESHEN